MRHEETTAQSALLAGSQLTTKGRADVFRQRERTRLKKKQLLVEWLGYKERSWEPREAIVDAAPELVEEFDNTKPARGRGAKKARKQ